MSAQLVSAWGVSCDGCGGCPDWAALTLDGLDRRRARLPESGWILEHESFGDRCPQCHRALVREGSVPAGALALVEATQEVRLAMDRAMRARNIESRAERERRELGAVWAGFGF